MAELVILVLTAVLLAAVHIWPRISINDDWRRLPDSWEPRRGEIRQRRHGAWKLGEVRK